jgi:hypothetical protein
MKKKFKVMLSLGCLAALCVGAAGCGKKSYDDQMAELGKTVSVAFDANGGKFMGRDGVTMKDYFNPSDYEDTNGDGKVEISLIEPTDSRRPTGTGTTDAISLTKAGHFFAGWYKVRNVKLNADNKPVDENGNVLVQKENGAYVLADTLGTEEEKIASPAYEYDGYWDFAEDKIEYAAEDYAETDGKYTFTLYAGWVPFYQFEYYYQTDAGAWEKYGSTSFDYKAANDKNNTTFADVDTLYLPTWQDGVMQYKHSATYEFPAIEGKTFLSAYTDEACTQQITDSFEHTGGIELERANAVNPVQKVFVKFEDGVRYKIETAKQLSKNGNAKGIYEILATELDFTGEVWPAALSNNVFTGKFESANGVTIKNVSVTINSDATAYGGLFGQLGAGASVKNVTFENVTLDVKNVAKRVSEAGFGLFAGLIDENATVENVTVGGTYKIGAFLPQKAAGYSFAVTANGNANGITATAVTVQIYGTKKPTLPGVEQKYRYYINPETAKVEGNVITLEFSTKAEGFESTQENIIISD